MSRPTRDSRLAALPSAMFDVAVVGGGVHGGAIFRALADGGLPRPAGRARGLRLRHQPVLGHDGLGRPVVPQERRLRHRLAAEPDARGDAGARRRGGVTTARPLRRRRRHRPPALAATDPTPVLASGSLPAPAPAPGDRLRRTGIAPRRCGLALRDLRGRANRSLRRALRPALDLARQPRRRLGLQLLPPSRAAGSTRGSGAGTSSWKTASAGVHTRPAPAGW